MKINHEGPKKNFHEKICLADHHEGFLLKLINLSTEKFSRKILYFIDSNNYKRKGKLTNIMKVFNNALDNVNMILVW